MSGKKQSPRARGEHCIHLFVTYDLKEQVKQLAKTYDRTTAEMVRVLLRIGIPLVEGLWTAEEIVLKEYVHLIRNRRKLKMGDDI